MFTKYLKSLALAAVAVFGVFSYASAAGTWDQDFENCSGGTTCTDWTFSSGTSATNTANSTEQAHDGTKSLKMQKTSSNAVTALYDAGSSNDVYNGDILTFWFYKEVSTGTSSTRDDITLQDGSSNYRCVVSIYGGNIYEGGSGGTDIGNYTAQTWTQVDIQPTATAGGQCRYRIDNGSWSSEYANGGIGTETAYRFNVNHFPTTYTFFDGIEVDSYADPRGNPVVTIHPDQILASYNYGAVFVQVHAKSNVLESAYPNESDSVFNIRLYKDTVLQQTFTVNGRADSSFPGDPWIEYQSLLAYNFTPGEYDIDARACFDGFSCGAYSSQVSFTVNPTIGDPTGGGGAWGGDGLDQTQLDEIRDLWGGGYTDWNDFITSYPDHDTIYGACDWWGSAAGDGLPCLWTWFSYAVFPDSTQFQNVLSTPIGVLVTRWPFAYIIQPAQGFINGLQDGSDTCPIPTIFPDDMELFGNTVELPETFTLCTAFSNADAADAIAANTYASNILVTAIYILFGMLWFDMARRFLRG